MLVSKNLDKIMNNKKGAVLIDLSWMLHRNYHSFKWMSVDINGYKRPTGHIYGVLYTVETLRVKYPEYAIILCQDGVPVKRQELYAKLGSSYKGGREDLEFDFYKDVDLIKQFCFLSSNVFWAYNSDLESDDIMYALSKQIEQLCWVPVLIYSGDNDLLQSIDDFVKVVRKTDKNGSLIEIDRNAVVLNEEFTKKFNGVDPEHLPFYRCIVGDSSDNLRGIPRFPRKLARDIAMSCCSFEDLFRYQGVTQTEIRYINMLRESREIVDINYRMMKLSDNIEVGLSRKRVDIDKVLNELRSLQMSRYLKYLNR